MLAASPPDDVLDRLSRLARDRRASLAALARREGLGPEDAVDCVQEALCKLLVLAQDGGLTAPPDEWAGVLAGIVRNAARNRRRRHDLARPHAHLDAVPGALDGSSAVGAALLGRPDELLARAEEHVRLRACVEELCEIQKAVVTLRMLEEHAGEDVAQALGISAGHVAVLLHRAKTALRACMTEPESRARAS